MKGMDGWTFAQRIELLMRRAFNGKREVFSGMKDLDASLRRWRHP